MRKILAGKVGTVLLCIVAALAGYFGNLQIQTYLGERAIENTGLELHSLEQAKVKAKAEDKKILVDVSAVWCSTCRKLDNEVFANAKVKEVIEKDYVVARLEYETPAGEAFLKKRGVEGVPNLWLLDKDGNDIKRLGLTFDPEEFAAQLER